MPQPTPSRSHAVDRLVAWAVYALLAVVGLGVGLIGSFSQGATWAVLGVDLPVGLVVSLAASLVVIVGAGLLAGSRLGAALAFLGWLLATTVMALKRPEGDLVVPATAAGLVWLFGGTVLGGLALAWPYGTPVRRR